MTDIQAVLTQVCVDLYSADIEPVVTRPDEQFGDYATNVALQLAKKTGKNPRDIAETIAEELRVALKGHVSEVSIAGPGFINITLSDAALVQMMHGIMDMPRLHNGSVVVIEYSDMNPFKQSHVGHLYTTIVGDVISRLYETSGATVHRVNFGGDVGLHVAKAMWAIIQFLKGEAPEGLTLVEANSRQRMSWLSDRYIEGNRAYESDATSKQEIIDINSRVYAVHAQNDRESSFARIYWTCREWSYAYFKEFYDELAVEQFEKYYPESVTAPEGVRVVHQQLENGIYELSDGAVIFDGERYGLHKRVFINSNNLPTYEAKDIGLAIQKWQDYHFDLSLIITGSDITEYMKVVLKSIEQFEPEPARRTLHVPHGNVKLTGGVKMSSRLGNGLSPEDVLESARVATRELTGKDNDSAVLAAVKYAFLRSRIGADIIYDPAESVSVHGNSGPYLQYAHARARSILAKSGDTILAGQAIAFHEGERTLARKLTEYPEVIRRAIEEHMPHHICTYLYELAQTFNHFYEHNRVLGDERQDTRMWLVRSYADVLQAGLQLLGIEAPERM